ncbi:MAG: helix-turn-helix transcriptional regulator [Pseudomonadota bacterium]
MADKIDFRVASSQQILSELSARVSRIRLSRNMTQAELAREAGVGMRTLRRLEDGENVSMDTFVRVLIALDLQGGLERLLPEQGIRPLERVHMKGRERQRARKPRTAKDKADETWSWGEEL